MRTWSPGRAHAVLEAVRTHAVESLRRGDRPEPLAIAMNSDFADSAALPWT